MYLSGRSSFRLLPTNQYTVTRQFSKKNLPQLVIPIKEKISKLHGIYRLDELNAIRSNKQLQDKIIQREERIFKDWDQKLLYHQVQWKKHIFGRSYDPIAQQVHEDYGEYQYFVEGAQNAIGNDYEVYKRIKLTNLSRASSQEEVDSLKEEVLDVEKITYLDKRKYSGKMRVDQLKMSEDQSFIGFVIEMGNQEQYVGGVKDMAKGKIIDSLSFKDISQLEFGKSNETLYVVEVDDARRPYLVKRVNLNTLAQQTIFTDPEPTNYVEIQKTKDGKFMVVSSNTKEDSEVWVLESDEDPFPKLIVPRQKNIRAHLDHLSDRFVLITNANVPNRNYKVCSLADDAFLDPLIQSSEYQWEDLLGGEEGLIIKEFDPFKTFLVIYVSSGQTGIPGIVVYDFETKQLKRFDMAEIGELTPGLNKEYDGKFVNFTFSSPFIFGEMWEYNHTNKQLRKTKEQSVKGTPEIVRKDFESIQFKVPAHDGELIPLNVYYKKGIKLNRKNRVLMEAYGAYGISMSQSFSIAHLSAMERGYVIAQACVRGGGELGIRWHEDGKLLNKPNSFLDFAACANYLIGERLAHPNFLAAKGSSAGATLVAHTCMNMFPNLFRAVVLNVPFLDVLTTLLDETLPLAVTDHLEFGNPIKSEQYYKLISSYCPYENLGPREYPAVFLNVALQDTRVPSWGTLKFIEKLRELAYQPRRQVDFGHKNIVVRMSAEGGHFGESENDQNLQMLALEFAWLDYIMFKKTN